jgi:uncharacterized protein (DUF488 family)
LIARHNINGGGNVDLTLATIGYESASINDFIATLLAARISKLIDVREIPISRRKGFAKNALSVAVEKVGVAYFHLGGLGDPKEGREAARTADIQTFLRIFSAHLRTPEAQTDLARAVELTVSGGVCLMCYERNPRECHRQLVADAISDRIPDLSVRHLGVKHGLAATRPDDRA